ncbi:MULTISPECIES: hypothetical protein [unclassified Streptomyces]|uniref:hypothetical protein n=1 Tax=unclassified Streptomyces TaxID=2593676 RepID=UPI001BE84F5E|nr:MULTISPECIES: hypothetical protein [unclassified Streptomyces]MBT2408508.1 hypothetical protein [Streptomyces sp. ISL-21]MBT2459675.1 hypothetical protein [Streptomyces sp. ISL-86]MBT2611945.1 hypothetical protein [Streptomyces sp. ISL-87]
MTNPPRRYTVVLKPQIADREGHTNHGASMRSASVEATGDTGASGFPRYEGDGLQVDIDPGTHAVEAVTVDGRELPYGWTAEATAQGETPRA